METVFESFADIPLTENHVRQLHRNLLRHASKDERHRGEYTTLRNDVVAFDAQGNQVGVVFETASPFDTPRLMTSLVEWTNRALCVADASVVGRRVTMHVHRLVHEGA